MTEIAFLGDIDVITLVSAVKTGILVLGGFVTLMSLRAYRRTGDHGLLYLGTGFGVITFGTFLAGVGYNLFDIDFADGILLESLLLLVGFAIIAYSLLSRRTSG